MKPDDERFTAKTTVLIENVRHHIEEEEDEWFPQVREGLGRKVLQDIGAEMAEASQEGSPPPGSAQRIEEDGGCRHLLTRPPRVLVSQEPRRLPQTACAPREPVCESSSPARPATSAQRYCATSRRTPTTNWWASPAGCRTGRPAPRSPGSAPTSPTRVAGHSWTRRSTERTRSSTSLGDSSPPTTWTTSPSWASPAPDAS